MANPFQYWYNIGNFLSGKTYEKQLILTERFEKETSRIIRNLSFLIEREYRFHSSDYPLSTAEEFLIREKIHDYIQTVSSINHEFARYIDINKLLSIGDGGLPLNELMANIVSFHIYLSHLFNRIIKLKYNILLLDILQNRNKKFSHQYSSLFSISKYIPFITSSDSLKNRQIKNIVYELLNLEK